MQNNIVPVSEDRAEDCPVSTTGTFQSRFNKHLSGTVQIKLISCIQTQGCAKSTGGPFPGSFTDLFSLPGAFLPCLQCGRAGELRAAPRGLNARRCCRAIPPLSPSVPRPRGSGTAAWERTIPSCPWLIHCSNAGHSAAYYFLILS